MRIPRQWVNTPDHTNIAVKATTSNSARLIVPVTNSHAPAKRNAKIAVVVSSSRRGIRCSSTGEVSSSAAKPSTMPAATLSWMAWLTFSGTQPTRARFTPIVVRNTWAATPAPRRPTARPPRATSRRTRAA